MWQLNGPQLVLASYNKDIETLSYSQFYEIAYGVYKAELYF